jgi:hypothetical protein
MTISRPDRNKFGFHGITDWTFKRALVMGLLVGLDPGKPHRCAATFALRLRGFELCLLHDRSLPGQAGALERLSVTGAYRQSLGQ